MVLAESSPDRLTFRLRGRLWGSTTLVIGGGVIVATGWYQASHGQWPWSCAILYGFGALFLYSSVYSFTASQCLVVDGPRRSIRFQKRNLYGSVNWERRGDQFERIRVYRPWALRGGRARNWAIRLDAPDGLQLFLGENEFGSLHHERAVALAASIGRLAGITVEDVQ